MPTVLSGKVLVTGANGFVASWIVRTLLEKGYSVRATVRSEEKGSYLKKIFFADYSDKFEVIVVADITKEEAFDEAVKGVDAIAHTAAPFHFVADDPQEVISPAVDGTVSILKSARNLPCVKRIILLSSAAAIISAPPNPTPFTEKDWNNGMVEDVKVNGKNADQMSKYCASKTLAEKAAWEFYEANEKDISWDLVALNPPYIFGPLIHDVISPAALNTSIGDWYNSVVKPNMGGKSLDEIAMKMNGWLDVRDVALAHILSLQTEKAGGERMIIYESAFAYQDFIDAANSLSPSPIPSHKDLPKGNPGAGKNSQPLFPYDASKASRILGPELKYHTIEETTRDMLADFERRGW